MMNKVVVRALVGFGWFGVDILNTREGGGGLVFIQSRTSFLSGQQDLKNKKTLTVIAHLFSLTFPSQRSFEEWFFIMSPYDRRSTPQLQGEAAVVQAQKRGSQIIERILSL